MIRFSVPGKPMGKGRPRFSRANGRVFTPKATENYEGRIALFAQQAMSGQAPFEAGVPLRVSVHATFPIAPSWPKWRKLEALAGLLWHTGKPDGDNLLKSVGDACNGIIWHDDSAIADQHVLKMYGEDVGLEIWVEPIP